MPDAIALVAVYMGETDEDRILDMKYPFFNRVLMQLNRRLRYEAATGFAGNSFFKKAGELVEESNPLFKDRQGGGMSLASELATQMTLAKVQIAPKGEGRSEMGGTVIF